MAEGTDGIEEAFEGQLRVLVTAASQIAERIAREREQALRQAEARSQQEARELQSRMEAERRVARAELSNVYREQWWNQASPEQIGHAYQVARAWEREDPEAVRAEQRMRDELRTRYGVDVDATEADPAAVRAAVERAVHERARESLDDLATPTKAGRPIRPQYLARVLDEQASEDAVFIPDVGSPVVWAARYLTMNGRRRLIGSFTHGTMANALTQAIGVQFAHPERQVVAMAGDGGLAMLLGELLTVVQHQLPVKIVVHNNSSLNFIDLEMKAAGFPPFATELVNPDFARVAESMGITGLRVTESADLVESVRQAFDHPGPVLLDVVTEPNEMTIPPAITTEQVKGFTLYMLRTVMSGRGDELIDLARANLRQIF